VSFDISCFHTMESSMDDTLIYSDFPVVGRTTADSFFDKPLPNTIEEISFSGQRQEYCVCFIDMVNSTTTTSNLNNVQIGRYYSIFLNEFTNILTKTRVYVDVHKFIP
jgi:hypothetical protein